jgi:hypothetical protein
LRARSKTRLGGEQAVRHDGQAREEVRDLVRARKTESRPPMRRHVGDVLPEELDPSARRQLLAADEAEQRRLAGPVRPDDRPAFPLLDREAHAVDGAQPTERLADVRQLQDDHRQSADR